MMNIANLFIGIAEAQTTTSAPAQSPGSTFGMFLPMIAVFAIFYFLMIRPQQKQRKKHQELLSNIKKGDEVITTAGIHGKVYGIADNLLTLEVADNVRIKMDKTQVATVKTLPAT